MRCGEAGALTFTLEGGGDMVCKDFENLALEPHPQSIYCRCVMLGKSQGSIFPLRNSYPSSFALETRLRFKTYSPDNFNM